MTTASTAADAQSQAYKNMVDLQAIHSEVSAKVKALESVLQQQYIDIVDLHRKEFTELQTTLKDTEEALEVIARQHPEWFEKKKTISTPYGSIQSRSGTAILVPSEETTIALIETTCSPEEQQLLIRTTKEVNKEALETLDDAALRILRCKRVKEEHFTIKAKTVDLGKAVKTANEEAA